MLIGNVGNDPEIRATGSGARVAKMSLATSYKRKDGEEKTEWHRLTFFGRLTDIVEQWVKKGDRLYVEGRIQYSQTEGEGGTKYWTDIVVNEMIMMGSGGGGGAGGDFGGGGAGGDFGGGGGTPDGRPSTPPASDPDDDLPF